MKEEKKENIPEKDAVRKNLEKQFQEMGKGATPPESLKKEVFNTLDALTLFGDIADLFTAKFTETQTKFIDTVSEADNEPPGQKKEE